MKRDEDVSLSEQPPADISRYRERTRYFDEVAARRGHSSAAVDQAFDSQHGESPTGREIAVLQYVADGLTIAAG